MPVEDPDRSWGEYRRLVLAELERIAKDMEILADKIQRFHSDDIAQIKTDIALLKLQAAAWGAVASLSVTVVVSLISKFLR